MGLRSSDRRRRLEAERGDRANTRGGHESPDLHIMASQLQNLTAAWQQKHPNSPYLPGSNAAASLKFHRLNDKLFSVFSNAPKISDMIDVADVYAYDTVADVL
jgi:hypothetical protein